MCLLSVAKSTLQYHPEHSNESTLFFYVNSWPTSTFLQLFFLDSSQLSESAVAEIQFFTKTSLSEAGNYRCPSIIQEQIYLFF